MGDLITDEVLNKAMSFEAYMNLTKSIVESDSPGGMYQNEKTFRYTRSNLERMTKVLDNIVLNQKLYNQLNDIKDEWIWLVISEPWCGDASWGTPSLYIISTGSDKIDFKIVLRDENPALIKEYQTEGTDSIPKLICIRKKDLKELGTWGPRPRALSDMINKLKNEPNIDYRESVRKLHAWYEEDMTASIQEELQELIKQWKDL